jgi:hypothetical protein
VLLVLTLLVHDGQEGDAAGDLLHDSLNLLLNVLLRLGLAWRRWWAARERGLARGVGPRLLVCNVKLPALECLVRLDRLDGEYKAGEIPGKQPFWGVSSALDLAISSGQSDSPCTCPRIVWRYSCNPSSAVTCMGSPYFLTTLEG